MSVLIGGVICLVIPFNERDLSQLNDVMYGSHVITT